MRMSCLESLDKDYENELPDKYIEEIYTKGFIAGLNNLNDYLENQNLIAIGGGTETNKYSWESYYKSMKQQIAIIIRDTKNAQQ